MPRWLFVCPTATDYTLALEMLDNTTTRTGTIGIRPGTGSATAGKHFDRIVAHNKA